MMLATLEALYLHRSTTIAAENLGIAQPSVSWYLKQMRELTGDKLFIRTYRGLEPTDFCTAYYHKTKEILDSLESFVTYRRSEFNPCSDTADFTVAIPYFKSQLMFEALSIDLMKSYPNIKTNLLYLDEYEALQYLDDGLLDIYIGFVSKKLPKYFVSEKLIDNEFIVLCSEKSKLFSKGHLSKHDFINTPHIKLSRGFNSSTFDIKLKQHGLLQKQLISVPDIHAEIALLKETDCLLIFDSQDAQMLIAEHNFKILKTDFKLPQLPLYTVWHARKRENPAHMWLRSYLSSRCSA